MSDGRHDRGHERRQDRAGGLGATDLYERPRTAFVANFLGVSNLVDGKVRARRRRWRRVETARRRRAPRARARAAAAHAATPCASACGRRRSTLVPGRRAPSPDGANVLRGTVVVAAFLGVSIQYVDPGRRAARSSPSSPRTRDGAEPDGAGRRPRGPAGLGARSTRSSWHAWLTATSSGAELPRRARAASLGRSAQLRCAGLRDRRATLERGARRPADADPATITPPEGRRSATGRSPTGRSTSTRRCSRASTSVRRPRQVRRGHQRQRRVLRQGPPAAAGQDQPIGRDIVTLTDYMAAQVGAQRLRRAAGQEEHPELVKNLVDNLKSITVRPEARVHAAVAVGRDRASATTRRRPGAS